MFDSPNLILFNGPPGSGKDLAANIVAATADNVHQAKFADEVKRGSHEALGVGAMPNDATESYKDYSQPGIMNDRSWRDVYIAFSEQFMKPLFGLRIFGKLLAIKLAYLKHDRNEIVDTITISDSGFIPEAEELLQARDWDGNLLFQQRDVVIIRLRREGCDFSNDSRGLVSLKGAGYPRVREFDIINDGTPYDLELKLHAVLGSEIMKPRLHQLQVQIPGASGDPAWAVIRSDVETIEEARAILETSRRAQYSNRVCRILRGGETVQVVYPGDASVYEFEVAQ
jgi:hypothetical protein